MNKNRRGWKRIEEDVKELKMMQRIEENGKG